MSAAARPPAPSAIHYPDSDGKPMADNTLQFRWIVTIKEGLDSPFSGPGPSRSGPGPTGWPSG